MVSLYLNIHCSARSLSGSTLLRSAAVTISLLGKRWTSSTANSSVASENTNVDPHEHLYKSDWRFIWNEKQQLADRYVKFNAPALGQKAAEALGSSQCVSFKKLELNEFNRDIVLTMDDGKQAVARLPTPGAGFPGYTVTSEGATMDWVRKTLDIPAPRLISYCNSADLTDVGAEYILMEKLPGVCLDTVIDSLSISQKTKIIDQIVEFDVRLAIHLSPFAGSLYYDKDAEFHIGATTSRKYIQAGRRQLDVPRGPFESFQDYVLAAAEREKQAILQLPNPPKPNALSPGESSFTAQLRLDTIEQYLKIAPCVLPSLQPTDGFTLWHPNLGRQQILVDPEEPTRITGILDWQGAEFGPMSLQIRHHPFLDFENVEQNNKFATAENEIFTGIPEEDTDSLARWAKIIKAKTMRSYYHVKLMKEFQPAGWTLLQDTSTPASLHEYLGNIYTGGEPVVKWLIKQLVKDWDWYATMYPTGSFVKPCPLSFSAEEAEKIDQAHQTHIENLDHLSLVCRAGAFHRRWEGQVKPEDYEGVRQLFLEAQQKFVKGCKVEEPGWSMEQIKATWVFPWVQ